MRDAPTSDREHVESAPTLPPDLIRAQLKFVPTCVHSFRWLFLDLARGDAVLQRLSHDVSMYLDRANQARERARQSSGRAEHLFHERMEISWMKLAASAAFVERVDLFLHTLENKVLPHDSCPRCRGVIRIKTIESTRHQDVFAFECRACGCDVQRTVARASAMPAR